MNPLTPEQAAAALADVEQARLAMRRAIRDHRGHYHLWIWGGTWVAMPLTAHFGGDHAARYFLWICAVGAVLSIITGFALGVIEGLTKYFYPEASNTVVFVLMVLVLLVKPTGLTGRAA